jgi:hypothetical protein
MFNKMYACRQEIMLNKKYKKVMGRPKVGIQNAKGIFFAARFTPSEARQLNEAIRRSGQSKSDFIRNRLLLPA